jgi:hypothetical protein
MSLALAPVFLPRVNAFTQNLSNMPTAPQNNRFNNFMANKLQVFENPRITWDHLQNLFTLVTLSTLNNEQNNQINRFDSN